MNNEIILIGNPNTGKTTLFNQLTGKNLRAGNWHGLTVDKVSAPFSLFKIENSPTITDLPGTYSLSAQTLEEDIAIHEIKNNATIINVCDNINLQRNLILTEQLIDKGLKPIILINCFQNFAISKANEEQLKQLNLPYYFCDFSNKKQIIAVFYAIFFNNYSIYDDILRKNLKHKKHNINNFNITFFEKLLLSKWVSPFVFLFFLLATFYLTFSLLGPILTSLLNTFFVKIIGNEIINFMITTNASDWLIDLMNNGIFVGFSAVFSFLPQMIVLLACFNFLEDMGIFSYIAYYFDSFLNKIGLSGKSVFSLLLSYGCNTSAVTTTRNLNSISQREKTVLNISYFKCSASLPLILAISSLLFNEYKFLCVLGIYMLGIFVSVIVSIFSNSKDLLRDNSNNKYFVMELPRVRFPKLKKILKDLLSNTKEFFSRFCTLILFFCVATWFLLSFSSSLVYTNGQIENSILYHICEFIKPMFTPLGFATTACIASLIASLIAKELSLSVLLLVLKCSEENLSLTEFGLSFAGEISFLIFMFLFTPCLACMFNIKKELGTKFAIKVAISSFAVAYFTSFVAYNSILSTNFAIIFACGAIVFAFLWFAVLKYLKKNKCFACNNKMCKLSN